MACRRFYSLEQTLQNGKYGDLMHAYLELEHMEKLLQSETENSKPHVHYYLPHHAEALKIQKQLIELLESVTPKDCKASLPLQIDDKNLIKALGLLWCLTDDIFKFAINIETENTMCPVPNV
ncbi:hypothetical protein ILUMI_16244 [Ignelater luminosus]|uniref:Uncharacterized protein n=1 Tax=Ignelater luminosus TaxID=2038154 RepID=A0A8K0CM33_IGNLU|nr:hypothetical protein ILUMI_16244 [Ignelater luminosus]